jgi:hypothetical protein
VNSVEENAFFSIQQPRDAMLSMNKTHAHFGHNEIGEHNLFEHREFFWLTLLK